MTLFIKDKPRTTTLDKKCKKKTHLFLNDKRLESINDLSGYENLKVLYLQNNYLRRIDNLHRVTKLTHLYLQRNNIAKVENLEKLVNLEKLYLGCNRISLLEGLENLERLSELHVENQFLEAGECLYFEPRSLQTLSVITAEYENLTYLDISGNKIKCLIDFREFFHLKILKAANNSLEDIEDVTDTVKNLIRLVELSLQENPVTQVYRYRENLIANSDSLKLLDGKHVSENNRDFLRNFKHEKELRANKKHSKMTLSEDITSSLNLPLAFRISVSRAMSQQFDPKFAISSKIYGDLQHHIFPHWKSAPSIVALKGDSYLPRPFWKNAKNLREKSTKHLDKKLSLTASKEG